MAKCDYCNEEIDYLPFTCRYCGKSYCKQHRIPENHQCSFEFKNDPFKVKALEKEKAPKIYADYPVESYPRITTKKRFRIPRVRDRINRSRPQVTSLIGIQQKPYGTYGILIANAAFFLITFILTNINSVFYEYLYLSVSDYVGNFGYWTFFTAIFLPDVPTFMGFIWSLLKLLMIFLIGRMIETRWGWKTLTKIYIISGLLASLGILLIQFISNIFIPGINSVEYYSSWGAYLGLVSFIALLFPQQQVTMFLYFIPIRIKMKNLIWIFVGFSGIAGLLNFIFIITGYYDVSNALFPMHFGGLAGVLGGLIMNRLIRRNY